MTEENQPENHVMPEKPRWPLVQWVDVKPDGYKMLMGEFTKDDHYRRAGLVVHDKALWYGTGEEADPRATPHQALLSDILGAMILRDPSQSVGSSVSNVSFTKSDGVRYHYVIFSRSSREDRGGFVEVLNQAILRANEILKPYGDYIPVFMEGYTGFAPGIRNPKRPMQIDIE